MFGDWCPECIQPPEPKFFVWAGVSIAIVLFAGLMSGLTLGPPRFNNPRSGFSNSTSLNWKSYKRMLPWPVRLDCPSAQLMFLQIPVSHHFRLDNIIGGCSSTIPQHWHIIGKKVWNAAAMEALPLFLNKLVPEWLPCSVLAWLDFSLELMCHDAISVRAQAIILSVSFVLFFGEVIPQAVCQRFGLAIGGWLSWLVTLLMFLALPISWPVAKLLDLLLGSDHDHKLDKDEFLANAVCHDTAHGGPLTDDEWHIGTLPEWQVTIIRGSIAVVQHTVEKAFKNISDVYMVDKGTRIDRQKLQEFCHQGHSRLPVYEDSRDNIIGILLVKNLLDHMDSDMDLPVSSLRLREPITCTLTDPLIEVLHQFRTSHSHMAVVLNHKADAIGIITMEDVIEVILGVEIWDETDFPDSRNASGHLTSTDIVGRQDSEATVGLDASIQSIRSPKGKRSKDDNSNRSSAAISRKASSVRGSRGIRHVTVPLPHSANHSASGDITRSFSMAHGYRPARHAGRSSHVQADGPVRSYDGEPSLLARAASLYLANPSSAEFDHSTHASAHH
eukprot:gene10373-1880_t